MREGPTSASGRTGAARSGADEVHRLASELGTLVLVTTSRTCLGHATITYANSAARRALLRDEAALIGLPLAALVHGADHAGLEDAMKASIEGGATQQLGTLSLKRRVAADLPVRMRVWACPQGDTLTWLGDDLEGHERHRAMVEAIPDLILRITADGYFIDTHVGPGVRTMMPPRDFLGRHLREVLPPYLVDQAQQAMAETLATNDAQVFRYPLEVQAPEDDSKRVREYEARVVPDGAEGVMIVIRDISALSRAHSDNTALRAAIDQSDDLVLMTDPAGILVYVNPAFERLCTEASAGLLGRPIDEIETGRHERAFIEGLESRLGSDDTWHGRFLERSDDGVFAGEATVSPVRDARDAIIGYVALGRDVSARQQLSDQKLELEQQLRQSQKMEALGLLAGGVAHDFNNMLAAIHSNAQLALLEEDPDLGEWRDSLADILQAASKATELTRQLLAFARKQELEPRPVELTQLIEDLRPLLDRTLGDDIALLQRSSPVKTPILADPNQLEQVVLNLAINARDAMPRGGELTLETDILDLDATDCQRLPGLSPGRHALLAISDTGVGMSAEVAARIFDPFFTTKPKGHGTGLGLATVFGIVQQSDGHITVYSEPGAGTTFRLLFPIHSGNKEPVRKPTPSGRGPLSLQARGPLDLTPQSTRPPGGSETILIVEDDDLVRRTTAAILRRFGYELLIAACGEEAMEIAQKHTGPIDLVLTDVIMPGISGPELAVALRPILPSTRVLFTSGYTRESIAARGPFDEDAQLVEKPFSALELATRVRAMLDTSGAQAS